MLDCNIFHLEERNNLYLTVSRTMMYLFFSNQRMEWLKTSLHGKTKLKIADQYKRFFSFFSKD